MKLGCHKEGFDEGLPDWQQPAVPSCFEKLSCLNDVKDQIRNGKPLSEVAEFIQVVCEELVHMKRSSLIARLYELLDTLPADDLGYRRTHRVRASDRRHVEKLCMRLQKWNARYEAHQDRLESHLELLGDLLSSASDFGQSDEKQSEVRYALSCQISRASDATGKCSRRVDRLTEELRLKSDFL